MNREEAEQLRSDDAHWFLGVVYHCKRDPRMIVRNRFVVGWTWNFGHPGTWLGILLAIVIALFVPALIATRTPLGTGGLLGGFVLAVAVLAYVGHRIASGPR